MYRKNYINTEIKRFRGSDYGNLENGKENMYEEGGVKIK